MIAIIIYAVLLIVICVLIIRWIQLKSELFPNPNITPSDKASNKNKAPQKHQWLNKLQPILFGLHRAVEKESSDDLYIQKAAFQEFESNAAKFTEAIRSVITISLNSAELHTLLLKANNSYSYIVVFPNRHEYPHLIRRYLPFSAGWTQHLTLIKKKLADSGDNSPLIGYLFFLSPDLKEGITLVSYADAQTTIVPATLVYDAELKLPNVRSWNAFLEFNMSGE